MGTTEFGPFLLHKDTWLEKYIPKKLQLMAGTFFEESQVADSTKSLKVQTQPTCLGFFLPRVPKPKEIVFMCTYSWEKVYREGDQSYKIPDMC